MNDPCFYRISVKGIAIDKKGRFLLSREDNGMWDMLGGGLEHGEDPMTCLKREIKEEAGLLVTYVSPTPKYFVSAPRFGHETFVAHVIYEIKLDSLEFIPSEECQELRYFSVEEAKKVEIFPTIVKLLEVYNPELHV
jgi:8-oxo-dGTP diphosphatase